jgi:hypothetical protein
MPNNKANEVDLIHKRYANRSNSIDSDLYSMLRNSFYMEIQERERELIKFLSSRSPLKEKRIIEIGCGDGSFRSLIKGQFEYWGVEEGA